MLTPVNPTVDRLELAVTDVSEGLGVDTGEAERVVERALDSVEALLDEHRRLIYSQLVAEADRFTKGAFADGVRHAATVVLTPPDALVDAVED